MAEYIYGENKDEQTEGNPAEVQQTTPSASETYSAPATQVYVDPPHDSVSSRTPVEKPKQKNRSGGVILMAVICVVSILLSGTAGYLGAAYAVRSGESGDTGVTPGTPIAPTVIYREVDTVVDSAGQQNSIAAVAKLVKPSVVEITTEETVNSSFYQYVQSGAGSGVIVSEDGYIITCAHVIEASSGNGFVSGITVTLTDGTSYAATVVGSDSDSDVALLKVEATGLNHAVLGNSSNLTVGEAVIAVGNPLGQLGGTVTGGIISALEREVVVDDVSMTLIQVDASINPGNSGGGLFNMNGELIGIVNAKYSDSGIEGLGFSIPSNDAWSVCEQLLEYGFVRGKVHIGITMRNVIDARSAYYYYGRQTPGVYVDSATEGYNDKVLQRGDRIISVNGKEINSYTEIKTIIQASEVGDVLKFTISRANGNSSEIITVDVMCYEFIPEGANVNFDE